MSDVRQVEPSPGGSPPHKISMRCPVCGRDGTFDPIGSNDSQISGGRAVGHRRCPNPGCAAHVFVVVNRGNPTHAIQSYPAERYPFERDAVPDAVANAFEEALEDHANDAQVSAAIMIRKTLEELCNDQKAPGGDLAKRIRSLGAKLVLPAGFLDAIQNLRLLGNDSAHVMAEAYENVGEREVLTAIKVTEILINGVYKNQQLLDELEGLKGPQTP